MKTIASATLQRNNETWVDLVFQDGSLGSCALENPLLQSWLLEGNTPLPADSPADAWEAVRAKRDQLIADSDWTMIPGATVDQAAWAAYRQVLRDLPQTYAATGPESVVWPVEPSTAGPNTTELE